MCRLTDVLDFLDVVSAEFLGVAHVGRLERFAEGVAVHRLGDLHAVFFQLGNTVVFVVVDFFALGRTGFFGGFDEDFFVGLR